LVQRNIFLRLLRDAFPRAEVTWIVSGHITGVPFLEELVRRHSYATEIVVCPDAEDDDQDRWRGFLRELPGRRFDVCVVDPRSFRLGVRDAYDAGIAARVAVPTGGPDDALITHPMRVAVGGADLYDYTAALAAAVGHDLAVPPERVVPRLPLRPESLPAWTARRPLVGVHAGCSGGWNRRWPAAAFAELSARMAHDLGATLVVLGSAGEVADTARLRGEILDRCPHAEVHVWLGEPLNRVANLIDRMDLLVGNDSGPAHLAAALDTPTVVTYGPDGEEAMWARVYPLHRGVNKHYPCQNRANEDNEWDGQCPLGCPCDYVAYDGPYPKCLSDITVDDVWKSVLAQLGPC
ncbi:MAG: glycosyltransferase family 9 protein, partial [Pseudonocardiaceae bacterium]